jgi:hypothetical protein
MGKLRQQPLCADVRPRDADVSPRESATQLGDLNENVLREIDHFL